MEQTFLVPGKRWEQKISDSHFYLVNSFNKVNFNNLVQLNLFFTVSTKRPYVRRKIFLPSFSPTPPTAASSNWPSHSHSHSHSSSPTSASSHTHTLSLVRKLSHSLSIFKQEKTLYERLKQECAKEG